MFVPARICILTGPKPRIFEITAFLGSCDLLPITSDLRLWRTTVHPSVLSFVKTKGSRTGLALTLILQTDMPIDIEINELIPSGDVNTITTLAAGL
jgi:hypothetical protein